MNDYRYDHRTVEGFVLSAIFWGVVGIVIGLLISIQIWAPAANFAPYLTYGRLRTVHTNGLAFGLGVASRKIKPTSTSDNVLFDNSRGAPGVLVQAS